MTADQALPYLHEWDKAELLLATRLDEACKLLGADLESPLFSAVIKMSNAYTAAVARIVGDDSGWLEYWRTECHFGGTPQRIRWADGREIMLDSVAALAEVIAS